MATPWERIDEAYQAWLSSTGTTVDEFNQLDIPSRVNIKATFDSLHATAVSFLIHTEWLLAYSGNSCIKWLFYCFRTKYVLLLIRGPTTIK
jgi:hypothetical protein